jgi:hypothetical protein
VPLASHVCTPPSTHCTEPGVQDPTHVPLTQAWFTHGVGVVQLPPELQLCTPLPKHCVVPDVQPHVQAPHGQFEHATAVPQIPLALHV